VDTEGLRGLGRRSVIPDVRGVCCIAVCIVLLYARCCMLLSSAHPFIAQGWLATP
jgi:hypothetical protein